MEDTDVKRMTKQFCDALKVLVEHSYCIGGASDDELLYATADYLMMTAHMLLSKIEGSPELPPMR